MVLDCTSMDELPNFQQKAVVLKEGVGATPCFFKRIGGFL